MATGELVRLPQRRSAGGHMDTKPGSGGANLDGAPASVDLNDDLRRRVRRWPVRRRAGTGGGGSRGCSGRWPRQHAPRADNSGRVPFKLPGDAGLVVKDVDERVAPDRLAGGQPGQSGALGPKHVPRCGSHEFGQSGFELRVFRGHAVTVPTVDRGLLGRCLRPDPSGFEGERRERPAISGPHWAPNQNRQDASSHVRGINGGEPACTPDTRSTRAEACPRTRAEAACRW